MAALIETLISGRDNSEVVRDKIAEIIFIEQANQQTLALAEVPPEDPDQWKLRVFTERSNPWEEFLAVDVPGESSPAFVAPLVNVWVDNINYDPRRSTTVDRQVATATFNIDCYGYGVSEELADGHTPGDAKSAMEAQRAARLVRQILMSAHYVTLATSEVWKRWLQSMQMFQPTIDSRPVTRVSAVRLSFVVDFNEFAPQWQGVISEEIAATIQRDESGEISFTVQFGESPP